MGVTAGRSLTKLRVNDLFKSAVYWTAGANLSHSNLFNSPSLFGQKIKASTAGDEAKSNDE